jgi:hypothetical protein
MAARFATRESWTGRSGASVATTMMIEPASDGGFPLPETPAHFGCLSAGESCGS